MTLIPAENLNKWKRNARNRATSKLEDLLELRGFLTEARAEGEAVIMQMYKEAAEAMGKSVDSVRKDIAAIGNYDPNTLVAWIQAGLPFDMLRKMNTLAISGDGENGLLNASPAEVIQQMVDNGNGNGKMPTVDEGIAFALSHREGAAIEYQLGRRVEGLVRLFKLPDDQDAEMRKELWQVFNKFKKG